MKSLLMVSLLTVAATTVAWSQGNPYDPGPCPVYGVTDPFECKIAQMMFDGSSCQQIAGWFAMMYDNRQAGQKAFDKCKQRLREGQENVDKLTAPYRETPQNP